MMPCSYTIIKSIADRLSYDTSYAFSPTALKSSSCLENRHGGFQHAFSPRCAPTMRCMRKAWSAA